MKNIIAKKTILIMVLIICSLGIVACSKEDSNGKKQETQDKSDESQKPLGNLVMKDEDGNVVITVEDIQSAETIVNDNNGVKEYCVSIKFTEKGKEKFTKVTEENVGKVISICVDDEVVSAPMVQDVITGGEAVISGYAQDRKSVV